MEMADLLVALMEREQTLEIVYYRVTVEKINGGNQLGNLVTEYSKVSETYNKCYWNSVMCVAKE
jgi:hypothetical protein